MASEVVIDITGRDNFSGVLGNFANIMTGIKSTIDLVAGAFNAVVDFGAQFVDSATEGQLAVANLEATLQSMGDVTGLSSQQLQDMAGALQEVTRFSDETILNGQAMLLTFGNIGGDVFPRATEAMLDLAAKFGSVDQASVMLGKALNDPIAGVTALRRVGVQLSEQQEEAIKKFMELGDIASAQGIILAELERQVGGLAEAYGDTFAGKVDIFKNKLDEIKETIGNGLLPLLSTLIDKFMPFVPILETLGERIGTFFATLNLGLTEDNWTHFFGSLERLDIFVGNILQSFADAVKDWAMAGGAEELGENFMSWISDLGTDSATESRIVAAIGNIFDALKRAISTIDWSGIALTIDEKLGSAIDAHEWGMSGQNFGRSIENAFKSWLEGESTSPDSDIAVALGNAISNWFLGAMNQPDWETAGETFVEIIKQFLIAPIVDFFKGSDMRTQISDAFTDAFTDAFGGQTLWENFVDGMKMGILKNPVSGIVIEAFNDLIDGVKKLFGISSPSTVFAQIGRDIISGLLAGVNAMSSTILNGFENLLDEILSLPGFQQIADALGIGGGDGSMGGQLGTHAGAGSTGSTGTGAPGTGPGGTTTTTGAMVVNQYFAGANITVGSWDEIAYDCIYPNPFVSATSGQLGSGGGGGGGAMVR